MRELLIIIPIPTPVVLPKPGMKLLYLWSLIPILLCAKSAPLILGAHAHSSFTYLRYLLTKPTDDVMIQDLYVKHSFVRSQEDWAYEYESGGQGHRVIGEMDWHWDLPHFLLSGMEPRCRPGPRRLNIQEVHPAHVLWGENV